MSTGAGRLGDFNAERESIVAEVEQRILAERRAAHLRGGDGRLEYVLNDAAFHETQRLEKGGPDDRKRAARWHELARDLSRMSDAEKEAEAARLTHEHVRDVAGNFDARVYGFVKNILPVGMSLLLTPQRLREGLGNLGELQGRVLIEGELDTVRALAARGTLVVTPTHLSNMDSIVIGFALERAGLPPCTYGAGKNLFSNPILSFFMRNLGAYRVDRRLRHSLYKDVLKEYSTVLIERGFHSLFFPGSTRSRSGGLEQKLKLGLMGTGLRAYENRLAAGAQGLSVFFVPVTLNYHLTLEAETLIDDYLAEVGKSRYIIEDDESSRFGRVTSFIRKTLAMEGATVVRFGQPLDPFGNQVDAEGRSHDPRGRRIDPELFLDDGASGRGPVTQRDNEYTRTLGESIVKAYQRDVVYMATHLVATVLWERVCAQAGVRDPFRVLRMADPQQVSTELLAAGVDRLRDRIRGANGAWGRLDKRSAERPAMGVVDDALRSFTAYHSRPVAERRGGAVVPTSLRLVYYYRNRMAHLPDAAVAGLGGLS